MSFLGSNLRGFFGMPMQGKIPGQFGSGFVQPGGLTSGMPGNVNDAMAKMQTQQAGWQQAAAANPGGFQPLAGDARSQLISQMQAAQGQYGNTIGGSLGGGGGFGKIDPNLARKMQLQAGMGQLPLQMPGQPPLGPQMPTSMPGFAQQPMGFNPFGGQFGGFGMGGNMGFSGMFGGGNPLAFLMSLFGGGGY